MQESVKLFLDYMTVERGVSPNTLVAYRNDLSQLVGYLETTHPDEDFGWQDVNDEVMTAYAAWPERPRRGTANRTPPVANTEAASRDQKR